MAIAEAYRAATAIVVVTTAGQGMFLEVHVNDTQRQSLFMPLLI